MAAKKAEPKPKAEAQGEPKAEAKATDSFEEWTKDRLYERAQQVGLEGRSQMTKGELIEALRKAEKEA
ncbi:MAG: Rho termination factor N-terminal domain-containing protein [Acidimicrobiia bacterium]